MSVSRPSVEKQLFARAKSHVLMGAQMPFSSGWADTLRCGKDFGQFSETLCSDGEHVFVICTVWAA
ncbi:hypothetical protein Z949_310 [Sulfitobacter guttiformis KCTC 32187]|nr:hypothetical protein Z949_310 [Sulfitobacter guttiformis KCTC 32187]